MTPARQPAGLSPAHLRLAGLLADTDLSKAELAARFSTSVPALDRLKARVYQAYGVHSRPALRYAMLALELPLAGAR